MKKSLNKHKTGISIDIEGLKEKLTHGHFTKIANKVKKSPQCIGKQFGDKTKKVKQIYILAAIEVLEEERKEALETNQRINKI
jgi:hypothetical protein